MLTILEYDVNTHTIFARELQADAASGEVMLGTPTDSEIREWANDNWGTPQIVEEDGTAYEPFADFTSAKIERIS